MNGDELAFLAGIVANPDDDTRRLVYCDWLDEHGQGPRAEFIRLQVEADGLPEGNRRRDAMEIRAGNLFHAHYPEWFGWIGEMFEMGTPRVNWKCNFDDMTFYGPNLVAVVQRGFVMDATVKVEHFDRLPKLLARTPLEAFDLDGRRPAYSRGGDEDTEEAAEGSVWAHWFPWDGMSPIGTATVPRDLFDLIPARHRESPSSLAALRELDRACKKHLRSLRRNRPAQAA